ncbi:ammonia-forming cytochrome c nitrite reductase subunit c552 [Geomonas sp. RF6]|uniref:ammonia-forming cytochrome c nitrite reductase subunit c552 n=1 Tax=Geomonas sp. RF6 TaxID=2897342 RepID=UPI001E60DEF8|nr:ammonia-forming cytochrome c nitrite reductase subunit c552 [Geomonas sp. RF6]UFS70296.1 ammonia-forming cytochrome c nitrite reductase subunit c552 [Geomonas sp. RF6]
MQVKGLGKWSALALVALVLLAAGCSKPQAKAQTAQVTKPEIADNAIDPAEWGKVYPEQYELWQMTSQPTLPTKTKYKHGYEVGVDPRPDKLDEYPFLALLYNGWGFGLEYKEPRGHYFMVQDQLEVDPGRKKAGGSCLACKTPYAPMLRNEMGAAFYSTPYKDVLAKLPADKQSLGVACSDCHDSRTLDTRISRNFTLGRALKDIGVDATKLSRDDRRTLVCAQCHVTYVIPKDKDMNSTDVVFPWAGSQRGHITIENIIKFIRSNPAHLEWKQAVTGFKMGFIRHPEYELFSNGSPHWAGGVTCSDCHLPQVTMNGKKVSDHRITSPLKSDLKACVACHQEAPDSLRKKVYAIQDRTVSLFLRTGYATATVAKIFEMANKANAEGKKVDPALYAQAKEAYEEAFYRLVFIGAENSVGFHNPQESLRVLGDAQKYAAKADATLRQAMKSAGVPVPVKVDLQLSKYLNERGAKKLMFHPEREIKDPFEGK